jgi:hypothetical protein
MMEAREECDGGIRLIASEGGIFKKCSSLYELHVCIWIATIPVHEIPTARCWLTVTRTRTDCGTDRIGMAINLVAAT